MAAATGPGRADLLADVDRLVLRAGRGEVSPVSVLAPLAARFGGVELHAYVADELVRVWSSGREVLAGELGVAPSEVLERAPLDGPGGEGTVLAVPVVTERSVVAVVAVGSTAPWTPSEAALCEGAVTRATPALVRARAELLDATMRALGGEGAGASSLEELSSLVHADTLQVLGAVANRLQALAEGAPGRRPPAAADELLELAAVLRSAAGRLATRAPL